MPKVTVITPSTRPTGIELVAKALKRQTLQDFEWLVVSPEDYGYGTWIKDPPKKEGDYWAIYKAYNEAIRHAKGELIVSIQDNTYVEPDALSRFWGHYVDEPKTLVSAVGNKYTDDTFSVMTWKDPRERSDQGSYYNCFHNDIEWNCCAVPKEAFYGVGGFDESLDKYSSLCGLDVLQRLNIIGGWQFKLDQGIKSYSLEHGRLPNWDEKTPFNGVWQQKCLEYMKQPKLNYL